MHPYTFSKWSLVGSLLVVCCASLPTPLVHATLPGPGDRPPIVVIDIHTHVFNAHDLPLSGIFSVHGAPVPTCDILAKLINAWTSGDDLDGPLLDTEPTIGTANELRAQTMKRLSSGAPSAPGTGISLFAPLSKEEHEALLEFVGGGTDTMPMPMMAPSAPGVPQQPHELLLVARALQKLDFPPGEGAPHPASTGMPSAPGGPIAGVQGFLGFLGVMMKGNLHIARQLETSEYKQVDFFLHHMMDLENAYDTKPVVSFHEQISRMARLDADPRLGGKFAHFVAFDPFRRDGALASVKSGLDAGALGVKFYPPSGYRATNNVIPPKPGFLALRAQSRWKSRYDGLDAAKLNGFNEKLFAYAEANHIPIFSHCTPHGFEAADGYGRMADPQYWRKVLENHPNLWLCLAHSGGSAYWFPPATPTPDDQLGTSFGEEVLKLCLEYPNTFCEAGYLEQILDPAMRGKFKVRLAEVINKPTKDGRKFGDKLMYGTDWHMIQKEPQHENYLSAFAEVFNDGTLKPWARKFFARNAIQFIHLEEATHRPVFTNEQQTAWKQLISNADME